VSLFYIRLALDDLPVSLLVFPQTSPRFGSPRSTPCHPRIFFSLVPLSFRIIPFDLSKLGDVFNFFACPFPWVLVRSGQSGNAAQNTYPCSECSVRSRGPLCFGKSRPVTGYVVQKVWPFHFFRSFWSSSPPTPPLPIRNYPQGHAFFSSYFSGPVRSGVPRQILVSWFPRPTFSAYCRFHLTRPTLRTSSRKHFA